MQIKQTFEVCANQDHVWSLIRDPAQMMTCIPGCESIETIGTDKYQVTVAIAVGPIKARFILTVSIIDESPPSHIKTEMRGDEGGRASLVQSVNDVRLTSLANGNTQVSYTCTVEISGRLGRYGSGMMQKLADRLGTQFREAFSSLAETTAPGGASSTVRRTGND